VVAEAADDRSGNTVVVCPNCGEREAFSADEIISITAEKNSSPI
jgi:hypothetical protein